MWFRSRFKDQLPTAEQALPGRSRPIVQLGDHLVLGTPMSGSVPHGFGEALLGMGCFWGAERRFWKQPGVHVTAAGYAGGLTPNPTYEEVCSGATGHTEVVRVVWDPSRTSFEELLRVFWESHDPTQGNRQGNDVGTQYRSAIYVGTSDLLARAEASRARYAVALGEAGRGAVTTEVRSGVVFYPAEVEHQQYLAKNPGGYCGLAGTGVACPLGDEPA